MEILYEDKNIIVIKKPAGVATQSANISQVDCVSYIKQYLKSNDSAIKGEPYVGVIHRLDQPVSGILVFAKDSKSAAILSKQVQTIMCKRYQALVEGVVESDGDTELICNMYKDSKNNKSIVVSNDKAAKVPSNVKLQKAILSYNVECVDGENTILNIRLKTGRFHQIRAQLSSIGHPIAGDKKYGSTVTCPSDFNNGEGSNKGAIALVACELTFNHPITGKEMNFSLNG